MCLCTFHLISKELIKRGEKLPNVSSDKIGFSEIMLAPRRTPKGAEERKDRGAIHFVFFATAKYTYPS